VIVEQLEPEALSAPMRRYPHTYQRLATAYKQLNAPFGELSVASINYATALIQSTAAYNGYLDTMADFTARRDALAEQIKAALEGAAFDDSPIRRGTAELLAAQANEMIDEMQHRAAAAH
jgi:hypothetical protein